MKKRLQYFLEKKHLNPARFAEIMGIQRSGISHILSGRNNPSLDFIRKMLENYPDLNSEWLITGNGEMFKRENPLKTSEPEYNTEQFNLFKEQKNENESEIIQKNKNSTPNNITLHNKKDIERIVFFNKEGTFKEYLPE